MEGSKGLKKDFISGVFWGIIEKFSTLFIGFFITILLARKLTPADYGLVNMIYIFTVLANVILDGGFGHAIIQKKDITIKDTSTVFYFNVIFSLVLYALLYAAAPLIANFYRQEQLIDIARVAFLMLPINSLCIIQHTLLTKKIKVKELTTVTVCSSLVSGAVGIILAYNEYGVWALVYQSLTLQATRALVLWLVSSWRPILVFDFQCIRSIWNFGINMLGVGTLAAIFQNIYTVVIGRFYNVNDVGFYNQAQRLESIASTSLTSAIQRVSFPAFAEIQNEKKRLKEVFKKVINITMYIHFPLMIGLIMISNEVFLILLGEKWLPSVPYFCLLCLASSLYPLHMINVNILKGLGLGKIYFKLESFKRVLMILFIFITIKFNIIYLLCGYVGATLISVICNMHYCGKSIDYKLTEQLKDLFPIFSSTGLMAMMIYLVKMINFTPFYQLIISISIGIISYIITSIIFKINSFYQLINLLKK